MALLLKNGAVFLHVPKTGGCFVQKVLRHLDLVGRPIGDHNSHDRVFWYDRFHRDEKVARNLVRRALGWIPRVSPSGFRFCFVREPLSWYVSCWRFMESRKWKREGDEANPYHWNPLEMLNGLGSSDFNEFVSNVNRKRPGFVTELYGWYARPTTQFVGKQENLVADLRRVLAAMKVDVELSYLQELPPINAVASYIPRPEWDPALRRKTQRLEYAAYVRYGYPIHDEEEAEVFSEQSVR
jgi:hypothetical protein